MASSRKKEKTRFDNVFKGGASNWRSSSKENGDKKFGDRNLQGPGFNRYQFNKFSRNVSVRRDTNVSGLKDLLQKDATEVLFTVAGPQFNNFKNALSGETFSTDLMMYILLILGRAITAVEVKIVASLISNVASNPSFSLRIQQYMLQVQTSIKDDGLVTELQRQSIQSLLKFLVEYQLFHPASSCDLTVVLLPFLIQICSKLFQNEESDSEAKELLQDLETNTDSFIKKFTLKEQKSMVKSEVAQTREPPNNFREISVLPTTEEIHCGLPFFRPNVIHGKYRDVEHYLDVQYRLLREDFMRPLREGINCIRALHKSNKVVERKVLRDENIWFYDNFWVSHPEVRNGVAVYVTHFNVDSSVKKIEWENSKGLKDGSLICFSEDYFQTMHFATVVNNKPKELAKGELVIQLETSQGYFNLATKCIMIESQAYFEASRHTLSALQDIYEWNMPLEDYIINAEKSVKTPMYLDDSSKYKLELHSQEISSFPVLNYQMWPSASAMGLDESQYAALRSGVTKEFSIIQGPPGTGKTFIGLKIVEILLQNSSVRRSNSPIIVMCYTNHALDQFLEGILKHTDGIVRIGGRSKSDQLQQYQLNSLRRGMDRDKCTTELLSSLYEKVYSLVEEIEEIIAEIRESISFVMKDETLSNYLEAKHLGSLIKDFDKEKFSSLLYDGYFLYVWLDVNDLVGIKDHLQATTAMSPEEADAVENVWALSVEMRWSLYKYWVELFLNPIRTELRQKCHELKATYDEREEVRNELDLKILRRSSVVGMTTTGAAKRRAILKKLNPQIVIFEEAAEVLEAHIVTSLTAGVQHVILIGDHQQLKPNTTVYELSKKFNFDISLFERMVKNGVECHRLTIQHRMRPAIASLLVPHIYSNLQNHESVLKYENVRGISSNVFFVNHNYSEDADQNLKSHVNRHECQFLKELCRYLLRQDYKPTQITVLTTYLGQLFELKRIMNEKIFSDIRMAVVDNFQGEENDIILVSFVRSNEEEKIGFLSISNRVCVALSRAKIGLYGIGNFDMLSKKSALWKEIVHKLECQGNFGDALRLCCHNHPESFNDVSISKDFTRVPNGVCPLICNKSYNCGHKCLRFCHVIDSAHQEPCERTVIKQLPLCGHEVEMVCHENPNKKKCPYLCLAGLPCGHKCKLNCSVPCTGICSELVSALTTCNHTYTVKCSISTDPVKVRGQCTADCETVYDCGHKCPLPCGIRCSEQCELPVTVQSTCGHDVTVECSTSKDPENVRKECKAPCQEILPCDHTCPLPCAMRCSQQCEKKVNVSSTCGHDVTVTCSSSKDPEKVRKECKAPCQKILPCDHTCPLPCAMRCSEQCEKTVNVPSTCGHDVTVTCSSSKDPEEVRKECKAPCQKILPCGHACALKCGQACKEKCHVLVSVLASCGHNVRIECLFACSPGEVSKRCTERCKRALPCGHACLLRCSEQCSTKCNRIIPKILPCGHDVIGPCCSPGECKAPCEKTVQCGHRCQSICGKVCVCKRIVPALASCGHEIRTRCELKLDPECLQKLCRRPCQKTLECGHRCRLRCMEKCECNEMVAVTSPCDHEVFTDCNKRAELETVQELCINPCEKVLECGHRCKLLCKQKCKCKEIVSVTASCGHQIKTECSLSTQLDTLEELCSSPCEKTLKCGHKCQMSCMKSCVCGEKVSVSSPCGHDVFIKCSLSSDPASIREHCSSPCEKTLQCGHRCRLVCGVDCKCTETVLVSSPCGHDVRSDCSISADLLAVQKLCKAKCEETLKCGHMCPSLCGTCTEHCKILKKVKTSDGRLDLIGLLSKVKCQQMVRILSTCGHEIEVKCFEISKGKEVREICSSACEGKLKCGHKHDCRGNCGECYRRFRFWYGLRGASCIEDCGKILQCGHVCKNRCSMCKCQIAEEAGLYKCEEMVWGKKLDCGHEQNVVCGKADSYKCGESVVVRKPCGHWQMKKCSERDDGYCGVCKSSIPMMMTLSSSSSSSHSSCDEFSD